MSRASRALILSVALAALAFQARAANPSVPSNDSSPAGEKPPEVTVTAQRRKLMPRVRKFVNQIVTPENNGDDGIARWQLPPVCPLVSGLTRQRGEFILERLSEIAREAAVPLAGEHCRPNLYILVSPEPENLLKAMEKRNRPFTFGYDESTYPPIETPPNIVGAFIKTPHPVRVWYNSTLKDPWGLPLAYCPGTVIFPGCAQNPTMPACTQYYRCGRGTAGGSHLTLSAITTFSRVFVIIDRNRLQGVTSGQLAAYISMVGFAKLKPDTRPSDAPTILKLFNGAPKSAPAGMTEWDQAFLKSLYATKQVSALQRGQIARAMVREIVP